MATGKLRSTEKTRSRARAAFKTARPPVAPFSAGEPIRIVPLHTGKPMYALGTAAARDVGDLFDGKPHFAPASAKLSYRGGALLRNVEVYTIFWGTKWGGASAKTMRAGINRFFGDILASDLLDQLAEYSVPGKPIGHGTLIGTKVISVAAPTGSVTDTEIKRALAGWIKAKAVPKPTANTLYFIYLEPGIVSIMGGSKSCQSYCGYHSNAGTTYYAVMPYPTCSGCLGGMNALDAITGTSSHELCEAITDPVPGKGWYDDVHGEIGDICAWNFRKVVGHTVQLEWSNAKGKCI